MATETRVLELRVAGVEKEASVEEKDGSIPLYIKATNIKRPLSGLRNLLISEELYPSDGWVTHVQVDRNPLKKGGTISAWIRRANKTTSWDMGRRAG